jgi:hypothetical protein
MSVKSGKERVLSDPGKSKKHRGYWVLCHVGKSCLVTEGIWIWALSVRTLPREPVLILYQLNGVCLFISRVIRPPVFGEVTSLCHEKIRIGSDTKKKMPSIPQVLMMF